MKILCQSATSPRNENGKIEREKENFLWRLFNGYVWYSPAFLFCLGWFLAHIFILKSTRRFQSFPKAVSPEFLTKTTLQLFLLTIHNAHSSDRSSANPTTVWEQVNSNKSVKSIAWQYFQCIYWLGFERKVLNKTKKL